MKTFVIASAVATAVLAALTYRPVEICETARTHTEVRCDDNYCTATTSTPTYVCYQSHE